MKPYDPRIPRTPFAFAAVAMSIATLAVAVLVPAQMQDAGTPDDLMTRVRSERCVPGAEWIVTAIDVVAVHRARVAQSAPTRQRISGTVDATS